MGYTTTKGGWPTHTEKGRGSVLVYSTDHDWRLVETPLAFKIEYWGKCGGTLGWKAYRRMVRPRWREDRMRDAATQAFRLLMWELRLRDQRAMIQEWKVCC